MGILGGVGFSAEVARDADLNSRLPDRAESPLGLACHSGISAVAVEVFEINPGWF